MDAMTGPARDELILTSVAGGEARLEIAGIGARSFAFIVDWHIRLLAALIWFGGAGFLVGRYVGPDALLSVEWAGWLTFLPAAIIYFLYHPLLETATGTTPGKRYAKVRIATTEGLRPSASAMLSRNLLRLVDSMPSMYAVGILIGLVDNRARRLGDMAAGTILIRAGDSSEAVFDALSTRSGSSLDPKLAELVSELLDRWKELTPDRRGALARTMLERAGDIEVFADAGDALLRARLQKLLEQSS